MVRVSQESRDTQTRGVEVVELYPSRDCPGMDTALLRLPPLSEYPGIPGIVRVSQDSPGMDTALLPLPPLSEYPGIPGIVRVSQESRDTQTRGVEVGELYLSLDTLCAVL